MDWIKRLMVKALGAICVCMAILFAGATLTLATQFTSRGGMLQSASISGLITGAIAAWLVVKGWRLMRSNSEAANPGDPALTGREALFGVPPVVDPILAAMQQIVDTHAHTLVLERRARLITDKYGITDRSSWDQEVDDFVARVAMPRLKLALTVRQLRRARRKIARQAGRRQPATEALSEFLRAIVDSEVSAHDALMSLRSSAGCGYSTPAELEEWCAAELRAAGWDARVTGRSGDQGVDVLARRQGLQLVLQCKLYAQPVGNSAVQAVFAGRAFHGAHVAAVVATGGFTKSARAIAAQTDVHLLAPEQLRGFSPRPAAGGVLR